MHINHSYDYPTSAMALSWNERRAYEYSRSRNEIRSNLAPAIATGLLPIAIHTEDWSFVSIVFAFTLTLMFGVVVFRLHKNLVTKSMIQYKYMVIFLAISLCWLSICWLLGYEHMAVIPPIFVVVYESLQKPIYT
jgi:hypothetical protein